MFLPSLPQAGLCGVEGRAAHAMYYLAQELGADNVRVNMVVPSWMWGPPVEGFLSAKAKNEKRSLDDVVQEITGKFALRRMTEDGEVAEARSSSAPIARKAITGQHLLVNTGELMH
jgi:NAD(P)-dependent dehydrogenase (short-subunit alcohol dehydrogenase family)